MKADSIKLGGTYSDERFGLRRVLEIGPHIKTLGMHSDAVGVRYEVLMAIKGVDVGTQSSMELKSFATWAKAEIAAADVQAHLTALKGIKVADKLTAPQRAFLQTFDVDLAEGDSVECARSEFRVAVACREKGLISSMPDRLDKHDKFFDVQFTPLGLAVLSNVLGGESILF